MEKVKEVASGSPSSQSGPTVPAHWDEADFITATDVVPVRVPLERLEIGRTKYVATDLNDLELLYELESSGLRITCSTSSSDGTTPPATFSVSDISAADLSLVNVIPGSLESMVARLVLETEEPIECLIPSSLSKDGTVSQLLSAGCNSEDATNCVGTDGDGGSGHEEVLVKMVHCRIVVMTASVHEAGHLRDILLFLKGGYEGKVSPDAIFLSPRPTQPQQQQEETGEPPRNARSDSSNVTSEITSSQITFLEPLPFWVRYVPWWIYSRNMRISIQNTLFIYSLFSVVWAFWQLYRNVNVIQNVLEPIIAVLKEVYLASVIDVFDRCLAVFTDFWMRFLSPLNIIQGLLLAPVLQAMLQLKTIFLPLAQITYSLVLVVWQCLPNTQLLAFLSSTVFGVYTLVCVMGQALWLVVTHLMKPVQLIWQGVLNSRIAVTSLDLHRLKLSWVLNVFLGSIRAIGNGTAKLCGYTSKRRKVLKAKKDPSKYLRMHSPSPRRSSAHPRMPVYYSSPLTKED